MISSINDDFGRSITMKRLDHFSTVFHVYIIRKNSLSKNDNFANQSWFWSINDTETSRSFLFPCSMSNYLQNVIQYTWWFGSRMMIFVNRWRRNVSIIFVTMINAYNICKNTLSKQDDLVNQLWFWSINDDETSRSFFYRVRCLYYSQKLVK